MFFDTKSVLLAATLALGSKPVIAQSAFPFDVQRDASGQLTRIELPLRTSFQSAQGEDVLAELRASLADYQTNTAAVGALEAAAPVPDNADDRKTYAQAKAFLKSGVDLRTLNDSRLDSEYARAKSKILTVKLYRLLAAPNSVAAFDREEILAETIKDVLSQAGNVLGVATPVYSVFDFLVGQYIECLGSRREFFQNQLLVLLDNGSAPFTAKEKSAIRSSVFYSRLSFINLPARKNAAKAWATYGDDQLAKALKPCKGYVAAGEASWGSCFKQQGDLIKNRMVNKVALSKKESLAFDMKNPHRVEDTRILLMLARLGTKLLPVPSIAKEPIYIWLDSQYKNQRKSEGYLFGYTTLRNQTDLSNWVLLNSANPIISK